ncbi:MAG: hypothetical protein C0408_03445 [Odoribacter sp.]|nr:hypothetical protein [Odoribacter sp.]
MEIPTAIKANPNRNCVQTTQLRFVDTTSMYGLQSGFIAQGRYNRLVQKAKEAIEMPIVL